MYFDKMMERAEAGKHNHNLDPNLPFRLAMVLGGVKLGVGRCNSLELAVSEARMHSASC
jgi:hypothetical protein